MDRFSNMRKYVELISFLTAGSMFQALRYLLHYLFSSIVRAQQPANTIMKTPSPAGGGGSRSHCGPPEHCLSTTGFPDAVCAEEPLIGVIALQWFSFTLFTENVLITF